MYANSLLPSEGLSAGGRVGHSAFRRGRRGMGLSPSERRMGLGHVIIQKGLGNVEAVSLQRILLHPLSLPYMCDQMIRVMWL